jgi:hypothetical protein
MGFEEESEAWRSALNKVQRLTLEHEHEKKHGTEVHEGMTPAERQTTLSLPLTAQHEHATVTGRHLDAAKAELDAAARPLTALRGAINNAVRA